MTQEKETDLVARATLAKKQLDNLVAPDAHAGMKDLGDIANIARDWALWAMIQELEQEANDREIHGGKDPVTTAMRYLAVQWSQKLEAAGIPRREGV